MSDQDPEPESPQLYPNTPGLAYLRWTGPTILGRIQLGFRILGIILALIASLSLYYVWRIFGFSNPWPRTFLAAVVRCCGAKVTSIGTPLKRDVFFISNHISWLDIPVIGSRNGSAFVAQDGIANWPVIGWLCRLNNTVFVSRTSRMSVASQINDIREALADSWAITIFPEGTTSNGRELLPFKSPLLAVVDPPPPGTMVQPIFLDLGNLAPDVAWIGEEPVWHNAIRLLTRRGSFPLYVHFLDPFDAHDYAGRKAVAAEARRRIEAALCASMGNEPPL
jgi:lyso-ornithine lipid O-acyltransferase